MKRIMVEGYEVTIEMAGDKFLVSVPKLPGCSVQVDNEKDAEREIRRMMDIYVPALPLLAKKRESADPQRPKLPKIRR